MFTGQREITGLGIYHYGARFYSPYINRFLSADTIVPSYANPQNLNRFAYVLNNPLRYTDPTGHMACSDAYDFCGQMVFDGQITVSILRRALRRYNVKLKGTWDVKHANAVYFGVAAVGGKFASERGKGESASEAFGAVYSQITMTWGGVGATGDCASATSGGCASNSSQINFWSMSSYSMEKNVVHELGHAYDHSLHDGPRRDPKISPFLSQRGKILRPNPVCDNCYDWQQHPPSMDSLGFTSGETFADMFIAWTYNAWNTDPDNATYVAAAQSWMTNWLP